MTLSPSRMAQIKVLKDDFGSQMHSIWLKKEVSKITHKGPGSWGQS